MRSILERRIASFDQSLVLLAPAQTIVPDHFRNVTVDRSRHQRLVRELQRLRGGVYLHDGAVRREQLTAGGLHRTPEDANSWHLLVMDAQRRVSSCMWYHRHENTSSVEQLRAWSCALARREEWRDRLRRAIESELRRARLELVHYAEAGGWAVSEAGRLTCEGVLHPLGAYALSRIFGGGLGLSTATVRHSSASILQRLGLKRMQVEGLEVAPYYDPHYECEMELLQFDTRRPSPRYLGAIEMLQQKLMETPVIARDAIAIAAESTEQVAAPMQLHYA